MTDAPTAQPLSGEALDEVHRLVLAFGHELGNLMAGVRLQAFMLTDDPKPRALATASILLDDLSAKACSLLALTRPLLAPPAAATGDPALVLGGLQAALEDHAGQGVDLRFSASGAGADKPGVREIAIDGELIRCLLMPLLLYGAEAASPGGELVVSVAASANGREMVFSLDDNGSSEESLAGWREQASRGRPLACQVAESVLARQGGCVEVVVNGGRTQVELRVPLSAQS